MGKNRESQVSRSTPRNLSPLIPGTWVRVQNYATNLLDRTGMVVEAKPYRQYTVQMDESGRLALRNRKHLRLCNSPRDGRISSHQPSAPIPVTPHPTESRDAQNDSTIMYNTCSAFCAVILYHGNIVLYVCVVLRCVTSGGEMHDVCVLAYRYDMLGHPAGTERCWWSGQF